jgi:hypothetical protein
VAGAWCLLAFVLVTAYQSVLTSYILAPGMQPPLVDSFADLANKTNIRFFVEKGLSIDPFLMVFSFFLCKSYFFYLKRDFFVVLRVL